jgi:hypothetical protein
MALSLSLASLDFVSLSFPFGSLMSLARRIGMFIDECCFDSVAS